MLPVEADDGFLLPRRKPEITGHPAVVVLIDAPVALPPVVELVGPPPSQWMNRPVPISAFSNQHRTRSNTRSRTSCGTHALVKAPQDFFSSDVLGHQLGLGLDLLLQEHDPLLFGLVVRTALALEDGGTVLKELFLPAVEHRWRQPQFLTH